MYMYFVFLFAVMDYGLLDWLNVTLHAGYGEEAELRTGAAYCQLLNNIFPGKLF
jgi:hypothetical protein